MNRNVLIVVSAFVLLASFAITGSFGLFLPNMNEPCLRCLCHLPTGCNMSYGCTEGYCGPFKISRVYWVDAGKVTLPDDDPDRVKAYEDCTRNFHCSVRVVTNYLQKYGRDCNTDGVTNCADYMMINGNGGYGCHLDLNTTVNGKRWLKRFSECNLGL